MLRGFFLCFLIDIDDGYGENVEIYGFNLTSEIVSLTLKEITNFKEEIALPASYAAVLTLGLEKNKHTGNVIYISIKSDRML